MTLSLRLHCFLFSSISLPRAFSHNVRNGVRNGTAPVPTREITSMHVEHDGSVIRQSGSNSEDMRNVSVNHHDRTIKEAQLDRRGIEKKATTQYSKGPNLTVERRTVELGAELASDTYISGLGIQTRSGASGVQLHMHNKTMTCVIVGGGWAGLLMFVKLVKSGLDPSSILLIDDKEDFGGTWYTFQYPGVAVDSPMYVPLIDELRDYYPLSILPSGHDIWTYLKAMAKHFSIYNRTSFRERVTLAKYIESEKSWLVKTRRGLEVKTLFVVMASGYAATDRIAEIPEVSKFKGPILQPKDHWTRANFSSDQSVAIIGTGPATAQILPNIKDYVREIFVFQKNAHWVLPRPESDLPENVISCLRYSADAKRCFNTARLALETPVFVEGRAKGLEYLKSIITNDTLRNLLTPTEPYGCHRTILSNEYLQSFNSGTVHLVPVREGVQKFGSKYVIIDSKPYKIDVLVIATGYNFFDVTFSVIGRNSESLTTSTKALHGIHYMNFPNFFRLGAAFDVDTYSFTESVLRDAEHVAMVMKKMRLESLHSVEPTAAAVKASNEDDYQAFLAGPFRQCRSWLFRNVSQVHKSVFRSSTTTNAMQFVNGEELLFS